MTFSGKATYFIYVIKFDTQELRPDQDSRLVVAQSQTNDESQICNPYCQQLLMSKIQIDQVPNRRPPMVANAPMHYQDCWRYVKRRDSLRD